MKIAIATIIFSLIFNTVKCQDTIYSYPYPNGLISSQIDSGGHNYKIRPIENPSLEIKINKNEIKSISSANGKSVNKDYSPGDCVVLLTEPTSGKIFYSGVVEFKDSKIKDLYKAIQRIPNGAIKYSLVSSDDVEFTYQKYQGSFIATFAGDTYIIEFNLLIKFKDGRIKYEYSDFISTFDIYKSAGSINPNRSSGKVKRNVIPLENKYAIGERYSDGKKFWNPIKENIETSIKTIAKLCAETKLNSKDGW